MPSYALPNWRSRKPTPKPQRPALEIIGPNGTYALAAVGILGLGVLYAKYGKKPEVPSVQKVIFEMPTEQRTDNQDNKNWKLLGEIYSRNNKSNVYDVSTIENT